MSLEDTLNATEEVIRRSVKVLTENKENSFVNLVLNPANNSSASHTEEEEPLPDPAMNFDKDDAEEKKSETKNVKGEQALPLPSTA